MAKKNRDIDAPSSFKQVATWRRHKHSQQQQQQQQPAKQKYIQPPLKRARTTSTSTSSTSRNYRLTLENSLSEEVLLRCLSFLDLQDLITVSRVSRSWYRLAQDPELWRSLYLASFPSSSRTSTYSSSANSLNSPLGRTRPWRSLFKISTNWRKGSARTSTLATTVRQSVLPEVPRDLGEVDGEVVRDGPDRRTRTTSSFVGSEQQRGRIQPKTQTILQFSKGVYFTAERRRTGFSPRRSEGGGDGPTITVHRSTSTADLHSSSRALGDGDYSIEIGKIQSEALRTLLPSVEEREGMSIIELRLDDCPSSSSKGLDSVDEPLVQQRLRLAAWYSPGSHFSIFEINLRSSSSSSFSYRELFSTFASSHSVSRLMMDRGDETLLARYHSPLIVTCSSSFSVGLWRVFDLPSEGEGGAKVGVEQTHPTLQTRESWWPVVLDLTKVSSIDASSTDSEQDQEAEWEEATRKKPNEEETFKITLAYSTPVFPASWTVGVQEFHVSLSSSSPLSQTRIKTLTSRHALATHRVGWSSSRSPSTSCSAGEGGLVTSIEYASPWIVTSRADNTIDVYQVVSPSVSSLEEKGKELEVAHVRTLFGHSTSVSAVAVDGVGRCVSGGTDGRVKVWENVGVVEGRESARGGLDVVERKDGYAEEVDSGVREGNVEGTGRWRELFAFGDRLSEMTAGNSEMGQKDQARTMVKQVFFDEEKIVSIVKGHGAMEKERVRVLRFD
ncbi:hypothetical protein T439DRAFT_378524 [Meredithblackwellia eburnea MCA 4105]